MRTTALAVVLGCLAIVGMAGPAQAVGGVPGSELVSPSSNEGDPPSTSECNEDVDGNVTFLPPFGALFPECVVVEPGDRVSWTNLDRHGHEPGDGILRQSSPNCWSQGIGTAQSFSAAFSVAYSPFYGEETLVVEDLRVDGEPVEDEEICDPDRTAWTTNEDGDVALPFMCHQHPIDASGAGWIILAD